MVNILETEYDETRLRLSFVIYILKLSEIFYKTICLWLSGLVDRYRPRFRLVGFWVGVIFSQNKNDR